MLLTQVLPSASRVPAASASSITAALDRAGLPPPRFVDRIATFEVTFPVLVATEPRLGAPADASPPLQTGGQRSVQRQDIVDLLRQQGELTRSEIAGSLGLNEETARKWLQTLRRERLVELTTSPRSRNARYRAIPQEAIQGRIMGNNMG